MQSSEVQFVRWGEREERGDRLQQDEMKEGLWDFWVEVAHSYLTIIYASSYLIDKALI